MTEESKPVDSVVDKNEAQKAAVESEDESGPEDNTTAGTTADGESKKKKKKSKRKKLKEALTGKSGDGDDKGKEAMEGLTPQQLAELMQLNPALAQELAANASASSSDGTLSAAEALKRLKLQDIMTGLASSGKNVKDMASYKFWSTQPVMKLDSAEKQVEEGPLKVQTVDDIPKEPPPLGVEGFNWVTMDLTDEVQLKEVYELLNGHYVEDDEAMFRFKYSTSILNWWVDTMSLRMYSS
jgi:glycylpeptide N-tetradecanoyltransferase